MAESDGLPNGGLRRLAVGAALALAATVLLRELLAGGPQGPSWTYQGALAVGMLAGVQGVAVAALVVVAEWREVAARGA